MPRDDLSIDMVRNMRLPIGEQMDPAAIVEDFVLRANNIPGETSFTFAEMEVKERELVECKAAAEEADNKLQKYIKSHGSHQSNPKEKLHYTTAAENYAKAISLSDEKLALLERLMNSYDKHLRVLDTHISTLTERGEPGFDDPDELPSLVRASAANNEVSQQRTTSSSFRSHVSIGASTSHASQSMQIAQAVNRNAAFHNNQLRVSQTQHGQASNVSASASAASNIISGRHHDSPATSFQKRAPRSNNNNHTNNNNNNNNNNHSSNSNSNSNNNNNASNSNNNLANLALPPNSSTQSQPTSGNPATPNTGTAPAMPQMGVAIQPSGKAPGVGLKSTSQRGSQGVSARKRTAVKSSRTTKRTKKSPVSNVDSDISDTDSPSGDGESISPPVSAAAAAAAAAAGEGAGSTPALGGGKPDLQVTSSNGVRARTSHGSIVRESGVDVDVAEDEGNDDRRYCSCQNVSFGNMVACDNPSCPYEWFHWTCVGLEGEPTGTWYCPGCHERLNGGAAKKG